MKIPLDDLVYYLNRRMQHPLPGNEAHQRMSSYLKRANYKKDWNEPARESAVCILFYEKSNEIHFPLIERVKYPGVHSGQIALPGGKIEPGETKTEAALRELEEETGFASKHIEILGELSPVYVLASNFNINPVLAISRETPVFSHNPNEVEQLFEQKLGEILVDERIKETEILAGENLKITAPYFDVQDKILWGATAMILNEMKEMMRGFTSSEFR